MGVYGVVSIFRDGWLNKKFDIERKTLPNNKNNDTLNTAAAHIFWKQ